MSIHPSFTRRLDWSGAAFVLALLAGCGGMPAEEINARAKQSLATQPAANWMYLPEHQPFVGERAVYVPASGGAQEVVEVRSRSGADTVLRVRWTRAPAGKGYLEDLIYTYTVSPDGSVRSARLDDTTLNTSRPLRIAGAGEAAYVSQPTVLKLPAPVMIDTGRRKVRADAIALSEVLQPGGAITQVLYVSDDTGLRVVRKASIAAAKLSVTDLVALVATERLKPASEGADPVGDRIHAAGPLWLSTLREE